MKLKLPKWLLGGFELDLSLISFNPFRREIKGDSISVKKGADFTKTEFHFAEGSNPIFINGNYIDRKQQIALIQEATGNLLPSVRPQLPNSPLLLPQPEKATGPEILDILRDIRRMSHGQAARGLDREILDLEIELHGKGDPEDPTPVYWFREDLWKEVEYLGSNNRMRGIVKTTIQEYQKRSLDREGISAYALMLIEELRDYYETIDRELTNLRFGRRQNYAGRRYDLAISTLQAFSFGLAESLPSRDKNPGSKKGGEVLEKCYKWVEKAEEKLLDHEAALKKDSGLDIEVKFPVLSQYLSLDRNPTRFPVSAVIEKFNQRVYLLDKELYLL